MQSEIALQEKTPTGGLIMGDKTKVRPNRKSRTTSLSQEQAVYDANLLRWISDHEGEHVLIKGDEVVGFFESRDDALTAGYARFGVVPLLVKQVSPSEPVYDIPGALF
jgi:hypothetical protein